MARRISVEIVGDSRSLERAFSRSSGSAKGFSSRIGGTARGIAKSVAAIGAAAAGIGIVTGKSFASFEQSMDRIVGLAGGARDQVAKFSDEILKLAPTVGRGPQELGDALYFVASAGIAVADQMKVVTVSAKAAAAGLGDTQTVADAVTSVMNAYGASVVGAAKATDILAATVREGKGEAAAFAPVIGNVAAIASQLGVSFDEVGAALAAQTRLGISAETAAIQLQATFSSLLKETPKTAKAFKSVGLTFEGLRTELKQKGLLATLTTLKESFGDNTAAMATAFPNIRALRGLLALVGKQSEQVRGVFDRMKDSTGALAIAFGAVSKDEAFKFKQTMASLAVVGIRLGAIFAPVAKLVADGATKALTAISGFIDELGKAKGVHAKFDVVFEGVKDIATGVRDQLRTAFAAIDFGEVLDSAGAALTSAGHVIRDAFDRIDWNAVGKALSSGLHSALGFLTSIDVGSVIRQVAQRLNTAVKGLLSSIDFRGLGRDLGNAVVRVLNGIAKFVNQTNWNAVGKAIVAGFKQALINFGRFLAGVNWLAVLGATFRAAVAVIKGFAVLFGTVAIELGKAILIGIGKGVVGLGKLIVDKLKELPGAWVAVGKFYLEQAKSLGKAVIDGIGRGLDNAKDFVLRKLLAFINKVLGVTGFLGRFDPFKGVRESVQKRLTQMESDTGTTTKVMQKHFDALHGKDVVINIVPTVRPLRESGGVSLASSLAGLGGAVSNIATDVEEAVKKASSAEGSSADLAATAREASAETAKKAAARAKKAKTKAQAAFAKIMDSLSLDFDKASTLTTKLFQKQKALSPLLKKFGEIAQFIPTTRNRFTEQLRVLAEQEEAVKKEIKIEGHTAELERQLFDIQQSRIAVRKAQREQVLSERNKKQFAALNLGPEGEQRTPSIAALTKRLGTLRKQVKGTVLDTPKTQAELQRIAKVLQGKFGKVGRDVRAAILQMFKDITGALDSGGKKGPLTKTSSLNSKKILEGLGLSPEEIRALRGRLSNFNSAGIGLPGANRTSTSGGFAGGAIPQIDLHATFIVDGQKFEPVITRQQQKTRRRNPKQKRGPHRMTGGV